MHNIVKDKDILVIGNALSIDESKLQIELDKNPITCAFNRGVEKYDPDIALFNVVSYWLDIIPKSDIRGLITQVSPKGRPAIDADFEIPLDFINDLKRYVGPRPSAGCIVNTFLAKKDLNVRSVTLIGFDFKTSPSWYDLHRTKEPHNYELEREYTLNTLVNKRGFRII